MIRWLGSHSYPTFTPILSRSLQEGRGYFRPCEKVSAASSTIFEEKKLTPHVQVVGGRLGVVCWLVHVEQVTVDVMLKNEAGGIKPRRLCQF